MDSLWMDLELVCMVHEQNTHSPQRIDIEMEQVVIMAGYGMVAHHGEADILVD